MTLKKIKIAIATNVNFFEFTLPIVINSLLCNGILPEDIHVFNSGFNEYNYKIENGVHYYQLTHNSFEYSPLIEIVEKELVSDYWFLIHDTCKVGPMFKELLYNIPETNPVKLALKASPAMSMGTYEYTYLLEIKDKIISIKNSDYSQSSMLHWKLWGVPNEDYIMWKTNPTPIIYNDNDNWSIIDYNNWYNTNTQRRTEYYPSLDLYKNKSNWGQTGYNMSLNI